MSDARTAVQKMVSAANTLATSGKLNPAQSKRFLDYVFDETMLKSVARFVRFSNEKMLIDKLGIGRRAAVPKAQAKDPNIRRRVTTSKVELQPQEIMVPVEIEDIFTEINLEGKSVQTHILQMFAKRLANDMEELQLHGDTGGLLTAESNIIDGGSTTQFVEDAYLKLFDGLLKQAATGTHLVDHAGGTCSVALFRKMLTAMPSKFKRNKKQLRWLCSTRMEELWREKVAGRATALGDTALESERYPAPFGIPMAPMPLFEDYPRQVITQTFDSTGPALSLTHAPIEPGSVVIVPEASVSSSVPSAALVEGIDYTVNSTLGQITYVNAALNGTPIRITYRAFPQIILTAVNNPIIAIGRDVRMEKDRDIYAGTDQYAITAKIDARFEELDAVVLGYNISDTII